MIRLPLIMRIGFFITGFSILSTSYSQTQYTLEQILAFSQKNSAQIKIIENNTESNKQQVNIYRSSVFPQIDFSTGIGYSNQTQRGNQVTTTSDIIAIFDRLDGYLFNWSLNLRQPLFEFGKIINSFHLANLSKKILEQDRSLQRDLYFLQVIEQFTRSYINQFNYSIAQQSQARSSRLFERVNLDFEYAQTSKRDLLRTKSSLEGSNADLIRAKTNRAVSIQSLNVLIGLSDSADYVLLLDTSSLFLQVPESTEAANREVTLKELETKVNENLRRNSWAEFFPTFSVTASINNEFFAIDTTDLTGTPELLFPENPAPGEYFNPAYFNYSLGVQLNWNIFDGTRNWAQYKQAKLQEEKSKIELKQLKREKDNSISEIRGQIASITNAIAAYRFQYEASEKALEQADLDFKNGFVDAVTYLETDKEYRDAARQLDEAKLQRIIFQAQLRLALGLPVYDTP